MLHRIIRKFNMNEVKNTVFCVRNIQINIYITIEMKNSEFKHTRRDVSRYSFTCIQSKAFFFLYLFSLFGLSNIMQQRMQFVVGSTCIL